MGILANPDGSPTPSCVLFTIGVPLLAAGHYLYHRSNDSKTSFSFLRSGHLQLFLGVAFIFLGVFLSFADNKSKKKTTLDKIKDEFTEPQRILRELKHILQINQNETTNLTEQTTEKKTKMDENESLLSSLRCLDALTTLCGKYQSQKNKKSNDDVKEQEQPSKEPEHSLQICCQEASYLVLRHLSTHDEAVSSALFLLALVAGHPEIRRRHVEMADEFGLNVPINAIKEALARAKLDEGENEDGPTEEEEQIFAELQRRGCLFLGALADKDPDLATLVANEGGLAVILDAVGWYRFHEDVGNWALWAIFILCYDHVQNHAQLMKLDGIPDICRVMQNIPESLGVQRHGVAILFDLLREVPGSEERDLMKMRLVAMNAGMQEIVKEAMVKYPKSVEIMMMGRQMLVATDYTGDIPNFEGKTQ